MKIAFGHPVGFCRMIFFLFWGLGAAAQDRLRVEVGSGYHREELHWSIAGNAAGTSPNILSELKWKGVSGIPVSLGVDWNVWRQWVVFVSGSRSFTIGGSVNDKDYAGDNRTSTIYDEGFDAGHGYGYSVLSGLGYRFSFDRFGVTPFVGYGWSGGRYSVYDAALALNSFYRTSWKGPLLKVCGDWNVGAGWGVIVGFVYHQVNYHATADWNLISSFRHPESFRQWADGYGLDGSLGVRYAVRPHVVVRVAGEFLDWRTGAGVDELYLVSGQTSQTKLNEVVRTGLGFHVGVEIGLKGD